MNDDLDEEIMDSEDGFDEFASKSGGMSDTLRKSPVAKIGVVVAVVAVLAGVMMYFGQDAVKEQPSMIPSGSEVTSVPGTDDKVAPAYIEAVEQQNEADLERALSSGDSAIPVPIETPDTRLEVPERQEEEEDPLHKWRMLQAEQAVREMKTRDTEVEPVTVLDNEQQNEAIKALSESMLQQMESVLSKTTEEKTFTTRTLIDYKSASNQNASGNVNGGGNGGADDNSKSGFDESAEETIVVPAGKIVYGQMLLEANSDVPSVVLAEMVSGPLKGWKLLGSFKVHEPIEMLSVEFDTAVNKDGDQYEIEAVMLDPDNTLAAMSTDVDHRYLRRVVLPAAAAFVEGFASAIADSGNTTVTVSGETVVQEDEEPSNDQEVATGVQEAGDKISEFLDDAGDVPIRIIIGAGTPIGIFFTENVIDTEGDI
ncbi:MAG: DotG/IcmE/VirB10 family protein [Alphaproteobacteria bacterium]